jgi:phosphate starvation-inducible PhoH-like protein
MAVNSGKKARKSAVSDNLGFVEKFHPITPLNYIQETYLRAIHENSIVFGVGSAGTGKTFIAAHYAAEQLYHRNVNKIILTRPNIETGKSLGYLPGTLEEKYQPYLDPFESVFIKFLGKGFYDYAIKSKAIDPKPLGFMRGSTFSDCIVLVDECQNATKTEFKMLLSRIGKNCKIILSGDPSQVDIKDSGLDDAIKRLSRVKDIEVVHFLDSDIVRSQLCKQIILAYNDK